MRAVVLYEHGGMEKFIYEANYREPECGHDDVIINVKACSLNYHDLFTRNGMPGISLDLPRICGLDAAGEIVEIGANVNDWQVGDRVLVDPRDRKGTGLFGETVDGGEKARTNDKPPDREEEPAKKRRQEEGRPQNSSQQWRRK